MTMNEKQVNRAYKLLHIFVIAFGVLYVTSMLLILVGPSIGAVQETWALWIALTNLPIAVIVMFSWMLQSMLMTHSITMATRSLERLNAVKLAVDRFNKQELRLDEFISTVHKLLS